MDTLIPDSDEDYVIAYEAPNPVTAELVCATLRAEGLRAILQHMYPAPAAGWLNYLGKYGQGVLVPASEAEAARIVLAAQEPTEEELVEEFESQLNTIEEAETRVR